MGGYRNEFREGAEPVNVIQFAPFSGADFILMLEVRNLGPGITKSFADVKASLMKAGQAELENSVEQSIVTHDIDGPEGSAAGNAITDGMSATGPGEYANVYLTLGYAKVANMVLKFRLVSNQAPGEKDDAVEIVGARGLRNSD